MKKVTVGVVTFVERQWTYNQLAFGKQELFVGRVLMFPE